ncbi:MAG: bifunctional pyr operon transcriptional regulator/uracil phosphoribosyltransferase PyrR [Acidimicrobiales bacterium]
MSHVGERSDKSDRFLLSSVRRVLDRDDITRAIRRISHEVVEHNRGIDDLLLVSIERGGRWLADEIAAVLREIGARNVLVVPLDVSEYRDDRTGAVRPSIRSEDRALLDQKRVIVVDDVLYTGRTVRACLDAIMSAGRPSVIQLAVLVDRGHRELPIRADYVGKNLPTSRREIVLASREGVEIGQLEGEAAR